MALKSGERQMSMIIPNLYSKAGRRGYAVEQGLKMLFLQFLEIRSDRQMEQLLCDSLAAKFFCNFGLTGETPVHSYFSIFRERVGDFIQWLLRKMITKIRIIGRTPSDSDRKS
jgi:transposase